MFCNNCGAYLEDGAAFCTSCGQAVNIENGIENHTAQTASAPINPVKPAQIFCGKCGSAVQEGMQHCTRCGTPIGAAKKKRLNILALICWSALLLSLFLPYISASADILGYSYSQELKLFDADDGIFFIIISIVGIVLTVFRLNKISIAADIIAAGLVLFETINTQENMSYMRGLAKYGVGFYLGIIAAIGLIISIFWNKIVKPK